MGSGNDWAVEMRNIPSFLIQHAPLPLCLGPALMLLKLFFHDDDDDDHRHHHHNNLHNQSRSQVILGVWDWIWQAEPRLLPDNGLGSLLKYVLLARLSFKLIVDQDAFW